MNGKTDPIGARPTCAVCGERSGRTLSASGSVAYTPCRRCGSATLVGPVDVDELYEEYFPVGVQQDSPLLERRYGAVVRRLESLAPGRSLLEVGCGNGQFLDVARDRGWSVSGTELSRRQVEHCRTRGLSVEFGDLARDRLYPGRTFDAVVLIEVIEHLPDPMAMLHRVRDRLGAGGILYLTTPNFGSLSRRILGGRWSVLNREHLVLASVRGLRFLLEGAGFHPVSIRSKNINLGELVQSRRSADREGLSAEARQNAAVELRDRLETSVALRVAKRTANAILGLTGLGDTIAAWAIRPAGERSPDRSDPGAG